MSKDFIVRQCLASIETSIVNQLMVERCRGYITQMHALVHLKEDKDISKSCSYSEQYRHLLLLLETDLSQLQFKECQS